MTLIFQIFYVSPIPFDVASAMTVHYLFTPEFIITISTTAVRRLSGSFRSWGHLLISETSKEAL